LVLAWMEWVELALELEEPPLESAWALVPTLDMTDGTVTEMCSSR
jgi:hypothetical protein